MDLITGKGPSARHEIYYFTESQLAAVRIDDFKYRFISQPGGWLGAKERPDMPVLVNLRLDPYEHTGFPGSSADANIGSYEYFEWFKFEFWRFVFVQQQVGKLAQSAIDYPPMQKGASFNLDSVKEKIAEAMNKQKAD